MSGLEQRKLLGNCEISECLFLKQSQNNWNFVLRKTAVSRNQRFLPEIIVLFACLSQQNLFYSQMKSNFDLKLDRRIVFVLSGAGKLLIWEKLEISHFPLNELVKHDVSWARWPLTTNSCLLRTNKTLI